MEGLQTRNGSGARRVRGVDGQNRPRTPGVAYAVLTVALAVLVGALALTSRQTAPPTIAEFAPQAVEQITDSVRDHSASAGAGADPALEGDTDPATGRPRESATVDVARVRQCVGDPPRQIEDPQSPPCVPYWEGDNGGATSHGVTRDEIRVADPSDKGWSGALAPFFNKRFEFYGRQVRLITRAVPGDGPGGRAAARAAYEQDQAFAALGPGGGGAPAYVDELARLGIVGVSRYSLAPEPYLSALRPFLWTYAMANDRTFAMAGDWYCARFAGRDAVHAGDPLLQSSRRRPGIILTRAGPEGTSAEPMNAQLASCADRADVVIQDTNRSGDAAYYAAFMENAILQMKTSGVTTVACLCYVVWAGLAMRAATNQGYVPEWLLLTTFYANDIADLRLFGGGPEQMRSLMLLSAEPMERRFADHPSTWAVQEVGDRYPTNSIDQFGVDFTYRMLLLLASGLQLAGPHLTPATFQQGLHRTRFPNPAHRIMAGSVGFRDGDHSMTDDAAEVWWSNTAQSPYDDGTGTFCYVDHGARRRLGTFPTDDPFFQGPCDNGAS